MYNDSLRAGRAEDRMPVGGEIFRTVETGPWAHPASSIQWVPALFPGIKRPRLTVDHSPPSSADVKEIDLSAQTQT